VGGGGGGGGGGVGGGGGGGVVGWGGEGGGVVWGGGGGGWEVGGGGLLGGMSQVRLYMAGEAIREVNFMKMGRSRNERADPSIIVGGCGSLNRIREKKRPG